LTSYTDKIQPEYYSNRSITERFMSEEDAEDGLASAWINSQIQEAADQLRKKLSTYSDDKSFQRRVVAELAERYI
jgi:hypothetical protein